MCKVLVEHVSSLSTSNSAARSMCGLPASPHNPVPNQAQDAIIACASLMPLIDAWLLMFHILKFTACMIARNGSHLGCRHKWSRPWSHTTSSTVSIPAVLAKCNDHMRALCDKDRVGWFLSPNKMSDRQSLWRALPRSWSIVHCALNQTGS